VIAVTAPAFHAHATARLGRPVTQNNGRLPHVLHVTAVDISHAVPGRHNQLDRSSAFPFGNLRQADKPSGVGDDDVVPIKSQARVEVVRRRLTHGRAEHLHALAAQKSNPTAQPVPRIERADYPVARTHAILPQGRRLVAPGELQFVIREVDALGHSRGARGLKNGLRPLAEKIVRREFQQVVGLCKEVAEILRSPHTCRINAMLLELPRQEFLVLSRVAECRAKRIRLQVTDQRTRRSLAPTHQAGNRLADHNALEKISKTIQHYL